MLNYEKIEHVSGKKDVLVDLDNTVNNLQVDLLKYVNKRLPTKQSYRNFTSTEMESTTSLLDQFAIEFFNSPDLLIRSRPFVGALDAMKLLRENNYNIHVASGRQATLYQTTVDWLERNGFLAHVSSVNLRSDGKSAEEFKLATAKKLCVIAVFEDTKSVAEILATEGLPVYLIRRPWNKEVKRSDLIHPAPSFRRAVSEFLNPRGEKVIYMSKGSLQSPTNTTKAK